MIEKQQRFFLQHSKIRQRRLDKELLSIKWTVCTSPEVNNCGIIKIITISSHWQGCTKTIPFCLFDIKCSKSIPAFGPVRIKQPYPLRPHIPIKLMQVRNTPGLLELLSNDSSDCVQPRSGGRKIFPGWLCQFYI